MIKHDFSEKRVLVTGGASGIGLAIAKGFCQAGASVLIADISGDAARSAADRLRSEGLNADWETVDVSSSSSVAALFENAGPRLDSLVCAAGVFKAGTAEETNDEDWERVIGVNLTGTFNCARAAIPLMRQHGGAIITVSSSTGAHDAIPGALAYVTSKGGVAMLTKALAVDYAAENIRVNAIAPGPTDTPMLRGLMDEPSRQEFAATLPVKRLGSPDEFAGIALFLASDSASFLTGAVIPVDGGQTALI